MEVGPQLRRDLVIGAGMPLGCYQGALRYVMVHADLPVTLVHGLVTEYGRLWWHAWCEIDDGQDGAVCDPTTGLLFSRPSFREVLQVTTVAVFTPAQAARNAHRYGIAGPWPPGRAGPGCGGRGDHRSGRRAGRLLRPDLPRAARVGRADARARSQVRR